MFHTIDNDVLIAVVAILIFAAAVTGFFIARNDARASSEEDRITVVQAASFALVSLMLGFSFSLTLSRYDARRAVLVDEANAIRTTALRTQLLPAQTGQVVRKLLVRYVDVRLQFAGSDDAGTRAQLNESSDILQHKMWTLAMGAAKVDSRSTMLPLYIQSLNEMIDLSAKQRAALSANIPDAILRTLIVIVIIAAGLMGFTLGGRSGSSPGLRKFVPLIVFSLMLTLVIGMIVDLDRAQRGSIRINLAPLERLKAEGLP